MLTPAGATQFLWLVFAVLSGCFLNFFLRMVALPLNPSLLFADKRAIAFFGRHPVPI